MKSPLKIIFLAFLIQSCSYSDKDFYLSSYERSFINAFKEGDTLYFKSSTNIIDSFFVRAIDSAEQKETGWLMGKRAFKEVWVSIRQLPVDTFYSGIFADTTSGKIDTTFNQIISIHKEPQDKKVIYTFNFKRFFESNENEYEIGEFNKESIQLNSKIISNYYIIKNKWQRDTAATSIVCLYWTREEGLVAYKYYNGTLWTKTSNR